MFYQTHFIILLQTPFVKVSLWTSFAYTSNVTNDAVYVKAYLLILKKEEQSHWSFCYNRLLRGQCVCVCVCVFAQVGMGAAGTGGIILLSIFLDIMQQITQSKSFVFWLLNKLNLNIQFSSVAQSCWTLCDPMNRSMPGLPDNHQLPEFTQTHVHRVSDAIQPSHPLSSPSPPAPNPSQHHSLFQWVNSSHEVAKVLEFQL